MFYEFRRYTTRPGQRDAWVQVMQGEILPYQTAQGMTYVASFTDDTDPDTYYWIRRFDSEAQRQELYAAVYDTDTWHALLARHGHLLAAEPHVTRLVPTAHSPLL
ncbi:NIPSNAP family protein [Deinococcus yunweiensis]|uniref:NIPSNAP family protein n=1 Tax=Deinococcus yunweiensis TaxID=367282 RepID=UPI00398E6C71